MKLLLNYSIALFLFSAASWMLAVAVNKWLLVFYTLKSKYVQYKTKHKIKLLNDDLEARWFKEAYERSISS